MKIRCCPVIRLLLLAAPLLALLAATVGAQGEVTVTPAQLSVAGTRGAVETRTLLLRATEPITGLQAIPLDLACADGNAVLQAGAIQAALPADQMAAGDPLTVPVTIDLRGASSGQFSGELLVNYHGGTLTVPMTVTVKDPWLLPLVMLLAGVGLGVVVSAYRTQGRPRDEVLGRVGQLHAQVGSGPNLARPFQERIEVHLVDVETALQAEKWQDAQVAIEQAQGALRLAGAIEVSRRAGAASGEGTGRPLRPGRAPKVGGRSAECPRPGGP